MSKVAVVMTHGVEEIEAVTLVDVLRRAGVEVVLAALDEGIVEGSRAIRLVPDTTIAGLRPAELDAVVLPGGAKNAQALRADARVIELLRELAGAGKVVAAICAAPIALEAAGLLAGVRATSYPGFELPSAEYSTERVVEDGKILTSRGPGTAMEFALALVKRLVGPEKATALRQGMLVKT
jgi:4-methyl-5(b-hydroxyethyl)-thiazole monophosphate biosynthesis